MTTLTKILIFVGVLAFLLWHPVTRRVIVFILPLGKGVDDLIFWALLIVFVLIAFIKGWVNIPKIKKFFNKLEREEMSDE